MTRGIIGSKFTVSNTAFRSAGSVNKNGIVSVDDIYNAKLTPNSWEKNAGHALYTPNIGVKSTLTPSFAPVSGTLGFYVSSDGTKMYTYTSGTVYRYSLSTAYDISTATIVGGGSTVFGSIAALTFSGDGMKLYVWASGTGNLYQYTLPSAWTITSAVNNGVLINLSTAGAYTNSLTWSGDGLSLYASGGTTSPFIYRITASTAFTLTGSATTSYFDWGTWAASNATYGQVAAVNEDGSRLFVSDPNTAESKSIFTLFNTDKTTLTAGNVYIDGRFGVYEAIRGYPLLPAGTAPTAINNTQPLIYMMFGNSGNYLYVQTGTGTDARISRISLAKAYSLDSYQPTSNFALLRAVQQGTGMYFKPDGTKLYVSDNLIDCIYQYTLGTAWDVSTASLDTTKRKLLDEDGLSHAITFKEDGTKLYMIGAGNSKVYQYTLGTAWDISTATYDSKSISVADVETTATGVAFSNTGSTMFVTGESLDSISSYELTTAWDVSTARGPFSPVAQDATPGGMCFGNSGLTLYTIGNNNVRLHQYTCAVAYNTRSITYTRSLTLSSIIAQTPYTTLSAIAVNSSGTQIYLLDATSKMVYALDMGTPWDLSTTTFNNKMRSISDVEATPTAFSFNVDGTRMYVAGTTGQNIIEYTLATAWDITTAIATTTVEKYPVLYSGTTLETTPYELEFSNTGLQVYTMGTIGDKVYQHTLSTAYDMGTFQLPYNYKSYRATTTAGGHYINLSAGGTKMYMVDYAVGLIYQYTLTTPYDVSTAVYDNISLTISNAGTVTQAISPRHLTFSSDGKKLYLSTAASLYQYTLNSPWSLSTVFYANNVGGINYSNTTIAPFDSAGSGFSFNDDGTKVFVVGTTTDTIKTYSLSTAWDVTTMVLNKHVNYDVSDVNSAWYNNDGTKMYVVGATTAVIYQYTLTTPYNISLTALTAGAYTASFSAATQTGGITDMFFKSDGTTFYTVGASRIVYQYTMGTPWDMSTASYANKSYNVTARDTAITYFTFSADGTKLFVGGTASDTVSRHALTTAWDVSTASFEATQTKSVVTQDTAMQSISFNSSGTKAFMLGITADKVFQYDLSTAWDVTTMTANANFANVAINTASGVGFSINYDGTRALLTDNGTSVYPYVFGTPWDLTTLASETTKSIVTQTTLATALAFKSDGTKAYVAAANAVYEYALSVPWVPDSASSTVAALNPSTSVLASETAITGISFTANGSTMFVNGSTSDVVHQLTLATPWSVNTATYPLATQQKTLTLSEITGTGMRFSANGSLLYVVGTTNDTIQKYTLSTPWDVSTATATQSFVVNALGGGSLADPAAIDVSADGTSLYVAGASLLLQYRMTTAHDLSTISAPRLLISAQDAAVAEHRFSADGTKLFVVGPTTTERVLQATLSQAWRPSTAGTWTSVTLTEDTVLSSLDFSSDGTKMYTLGTTNDTVYQYTLATPWDVTTASYASKSVSVAGQEIVGTGLIFGDSGTKMYVVGSASDNIRQYNLSTAWDVSTATYSTKTVAVTQDTTSSSLFFKPDGTRVFVVGTASDVVRGYNLGTAWDISTATYSAALDKSIVVQDTLSSGLTFSSDGTKMFMNGTTNDFIYTYTLSTAWDPSTARAEAYPIGAAPTSIKFNAAGTKLWVMNTTGDLITEYVMTLAGEIGTITSNTSFAIGTQEVNGVGFAFNGDGTKLVVLGGNNTFTNAKTTTYNLSTAYTPNTAYATTSASLRLAFPDTVPLSIKLSANGTKMVLLGNTTYSLYEYNLASNGNMYTGTSANSYTLPVASAGYEAVDAIANSIFTMNSYGTIVEYYTPTGYTLAGIETARDLSVSAQDSTPAGVYFKSDGLRAYIAGRTNAIVAEYTLTDPYVLGSGSYTRQFSVASQATDPSEVFFSTDGTKMYVTSIANKAVYQYTLGTAWNVSTATYATYTLLDNLTETAYTGVYISLDGKYLYVLASGSYNVYRFTLSTPNDLATIQKAYQTLYIGAYATAPKSITFGNTGKELYITTTTPTTGVVRYTLGTAWDLSTATYTEFKAFTNTGSFNISEDGRTVVSWNTSTELQTKHTLTTPWQLSTASAIISSLYLRSNYTDQSTYVPFGNSTVNVSSQQYVAGGEYMIALATQATGGAAANLFSQIQIRNVSDPFTPSIVYDSVRNVPLTLGNTTQMSIGATALTSNGTSLYVVDNQRYMIFQFGRI